MAYSRGETHLSAKLEDSDIPLIWGLKGHLKLKEVAEKFDVSITTVFEIQNRRTWRHITRYLT